MSVSVSETTESEYFQFKPVASTVLSQPSFTPKASAHTTKDTANTSVRCLNFQNVLISLRPYLEKLVVTEASRGTGFVLVSALMCLGAISYFLLPFEPSLPSIVFIFIVLSLILLLLKKHPALCIVVGGSLAFLVGIGSAKVESWRLNTAMVGSDIATTVTGRVLLTEPQASGRFRLTLDLLETERPKLRYQPARIRLTARSIPDGLEPGSVIRGYAKMMRPSGPVRPGSYDFAFRSYFDGLGAAGFFLSKVELVDDHYEIPFKARLLRNFEQVREKLAMRIRSHVTGTEGEVAVALIVGYRTGIPETTNEALRRSGLAHVLSISGLHMALVAGTVMVLLRTTAAFFSGFTSRFPIKKIAAVTAIIFCTFYLCLSGMDVAALRSYLMLAVMLFALLLDRAAISMRNVAIAVMVIVIWAPHEIMGPSFQMSFAATAALVAGFAVWTGWTSGRKSQLSSSAGLKALREKTVSFIMAFIVGLVVTSVLAGTATALYGIWHFQRATPFSLPSNLVAMPIVSIIIMPGAVCAILAMPFGLEGIFIKAMGLGIKWMILVAQWFSDHSPFDAVGIIPASALISFSLALVILVTLTTYLRFLALPFLIFGVYGLADRTMPDILVTEDAALVAVKTDDGNLAINRTRGNSFSLQDWQRALWVGQILKPEKQPPEFFLKPEQGLANQSQNKQGFYCKDDVCLIRYDADKFLIHSVKLNDAVKFCDLASIMIIKEATAHNPCVENLDLIFITGQDLARNGSAAFYIKSQAEKNGIVLSYAIPEPWRPWHEYRAFSREARGLAPYERKTAQAAQTISGNN